MDMDVVHEHGHVYLNITPNIEEENLITIGPLKWHYRDTYSEEENLPYFTAAIIFSKVYMMRQL